MKQVILILQLFLFTTVNTIAQAPNMKWGKLDKGDLKMKTYPLDGEADAVILAHNTKVRYEIAPSEAMVYDIYYRIKILTKAGLDQANIEIPYFASGQAERINGIKAQVSTLKGSKVIKTKFKKKEVFTDKIDEYWSMKKFTLPNVEVGLVIEYHYTYYSERIFSVKDFYFQTDIPTKWSQFDFKVPEFFNYVVIKQATHPFAIASQKQINYNLGAGYKTFSGTHYVWAMQSIPSLKEEKYITTMNDYRQRIRLQLKSFIFPGYVNKTFFTTWEYTQKELMDSETFGEVFTSSKGTRYITQHCYKYLKEGMSKGEKIKAIYTFVQKNMKWNGMNHISVDKSLDKLYSKHEGDIAEINLMLLNLLKQADIDAAPVLLSTRQNGQANPYYPILKQFDYVLVRTEIDGKEVFLDATNPLMPMGMVKFNALNQIGWLINGEPGGKWIPIKPKPHKTTSQFYLYLEADGTIKGFMKTYYKGYAGVNKRSSYLEADDKKNYLSDLYKDDIPNIEIDSFSFKNLDELNKNFVQAIYFKAPKMAEVAGDLIYFSPFMNQAWNENPFKSKERSYPIDFGHTQSEQIIINIHLPEGYELEELPQNSKIQLLNNGGFFSFMSSKQVNGDIQIISRMELKRPVYEAKEYQYLKQFFDLVIDKQMTQLVVKKTPKVKKP